MFHLKPELDLVFSLKSTCTYMIPAVLGLNPPGRMNFR